MKRFAIRATCMACVAIALLAGTAAATAPRPNILIIMCDDLGYSDVGFNGAEDIRTPALDSLARSGTICSSGYVTHPFCGPSRMGLMAGRYPHTFGAPFNLPPFGLGIEQYNRQGVPVSEALISTVLQRAGYRTGAIGKWHMGFESPFHPNRRGFDDFFGFLGGGHNYFPEQYLPIYDRQLRAGVEYIREYVVPLQHNGEPLRETEYLTDAFSREAVRFVDESAGKDNPFFLYVAYNAPHTPLEAKEDDLKEYAGIKDEKRRTYAAMVHAVDRGVGNVVNALKTSGALDNTLIIFLSDNGGKTSAGATNRPLAKGKGSTCEGGYRVPMFFHWPDQVPAGRIFEHPVTALDFYPTLAGLGGATIPDRKELDGKDIWADFLGGRNPRPGEMIFAMRHNAGFSNVGARCDEWKALRDGKGPWRLHNMVEDIGEQKDVSAQHPDILKAIVAAAEKWSERHTEPKWFHALEARDSWSKTGMPRFDETFSLKPIAALPAAPEPKETGLVKGDSLRVDFIAKEKTKWQEKGWNWSQRKVEELFHKIDVNQDGIASGREKKAYWAKVAKDKSSN